MLRSELLRRVAGESIFAACHPTAVSGHFYAEVEFADDDACGLALVRDRDGAPDPANFTSVFVETTADGSVVVLARDRQEGVDDVLDNTRSPKVKSKGRYRHVLRDLFSVPAERTAGRFRIFRDGPAGVFHLYYAIRPTIHGEPVEGWVELAPSRDWSGRDARWYVALCTRSSGAGSTRATPARAVSARATFDNLRVVEKPVRDRDDTRTGFAVTRREYNWSGFFGDAVVVTFGDEFAFNLRDGERQRDRDRKFVFWSEANYVPAWHLTNQLLYSYEFVETWGGGAPGCHEPMSDRLLRWSRVRVVEDNEVRKVVHWRYVLCNPDYEVPDDGKGDEIPEVDEHWTFYPDGTGVRHVVYTPKLDTGHRKWHELSELIVIAGSGTDPGEHVARPALTVTNLDGDEVSCFPGPKYDKKRVGRWEQVIATAHFRDAPDAFCVFSHARDTPGTYSHYRLGFDVSWHGTGYRMCHWPVGKEPYQGPSKTHGTWKAQVSHTSLMGVGVYGGSDWADHTKRDRRGRRYREWVSLVGLSERGALKGVRARAATWLYPGAVTPLDGGLRFKGIDHKRREIVLERVRVSGGGEGARRSRFRLDPTPRSTTVVNPTFRIDGWGARPVRVAMDGKPLARGRDVRCAVEGGAALVWVRATFDSPAVFELR